MRSPRPMTRPEKRSWLRRLLNRLEVDRAVFYAVLARGWQFVAGPVTLILIAVYFTPEVQGFYYTFWSMIALQSFFELSLHQVVLNVASHEWEKLTLEEDGAISGDQVAISRLSSLLRGSLAWYGVASLLFIVGIGTAGVVFFSLDEMSHAIEWLAPWWGLVVFSAFAFWMTPTLAVLEGCNQVENVYKFHFLRAVLGNVVVWICIPLGAGLWTAAIAAFVRVCCELYLVGYRYRRFFRVLVSRRYKSSLYWKTDVWPLQWRLGLKGLFGFFNTYLMNLVVFHYHGSVEAGRMGMTWQILTSLQAASSSWVKTRAARLGMLVAKRDYQELDRVFIRVTSIALALLVLATFAFLCFDWSLYAIGTRIEVARSFALRLLHPLPTALLALAVVIGLISECQWTYIHAHKQSPYVRLAILAAITNGLLVWWWGSWYGALGATSAYLAMNGLFSLPVWTWAWLRCRREWHPDAAE